MPLTPIGNAPGGLPSLGLYPTLEGLGHAARRAGARARADVARSAARRGDAAEARLAVAQLRQTDPAVVGRAIALAGAGAASVVVLAVGVDSSACRSRRAAAVGAVPRGPPSDDVGGHWLDEHRSCPARPCRCGHALARARDGVDAGRRRATGQPASAKPAARERASMGDERAHQSPSTASGRVDGARSCGDRTRAGRGCTAQLAAGAGARTVAPTKQVEPGRRAAGAGRRQLAGQSAVSSQPAKAAAPMASTDANSIREKIFMRRPRARRVPHGASRTLARASDGRDRGSAVSGSRPRGAIHRRAGARRRTTA